MATIRKLKSGRWNCEVKRRVRGRRIYRSATFDKHAQADAWGKHMEEEIRNGAMGLVPSHTLRELIEIYIAKELPKLRSPTPIGYSLAFFIGQFEQVDLPLHEQTSDFFERWADARLRGEVSGRRVKSSTVNRELNAISAAFELGRDLQWCDANPVRAMKRPQNPQPRDQRVSDEVLARIIEALGYQRGTCASAANERVALAALFALETAMRRGEITSLSRKCLTEKTAFLPVTKNGQSRTVPLRAPARAILALAPGERPFYVHHTHFDHLWRGATLAAGVPHVQFRDLRREAATRLSKIYAVQELAKIGGWRDLKTLFETYYRPSIEDLAER